MTTSTATVTEFVLARLSEDESPTFEIVPYDCPPDCCAPAGWVGHKCLICGTTDFGGSPEAITSIALDHERAIHGRSRFQAECAAVRALVADLEMFTKVRDEQVGGITVALTSAGLVRGVEHAVQRLALIWSHHPDFQPEWRNL